MHGNRIRCLHLKSPTQCFLFPSLGGIDVFWNLTLKNKSNFGAEILWHIEDKVKKFPCSYEEPAPFPLSSAKGPCSAGLGFTMNSLRNMLPPSSKASLTESALSVHLQALTRCYQLHVLSWQFKTLQCRGCLKATEPCVECPQLICIPWRLVFLATVNNVVASSKILLYYLL